ncbi:uncharacterized protein EV422DRAFT_527641 [Fimicolochytrium jonesii]|uniref:uncharacterized protein n=1 Tax=Fimicolochytrium jonesii TaxID=1396493 RepID=UPI0022FF2060|nr:uncharacterized protein EV422DRAFT_527641 [Fimicolochytrium jonesii]KAI8821309.1 hypothetical protein EV422DRAFT_527641 [Fimicolochytrium jonesii]
MFPRASRFNDPGASPISPVSKRAGAPRFRTPQKARTIDLRPTTPDLEDKENIAPPSPAPQTVQPDRDSVDKKLRDVQRQKLELEHQVHAQTKQVDLLQLHLKHREERIRILSIDNAALLSKVASLEDRLKAEKQKETGMLAHAAQLLQQVKELEKAKDRMHSEIERKEEISKKDMEIHKRAPSALNAKSPATPRKVSENIAATAKGPDVSALRDEVAKLEKEKRHFNAKLRDVQHKAFIEKKQLQAQISSLRNGAPAGNTADRQQTAALQAERAKWQAKTRALQNEIERFRKGDKGNTDNGGENRKVGNWLDEDFAEECTGQNPFEGFCIDSDRRLSGLSDMSEFRRHQKDDDNQSNCTLENERLDIPSFYRAKHDSDTRPNTNAGQLVFKQNDLILIRKKTSDDTWVGELNGQIGLVPTDAVEDCSGDSREFEDAGMDALPANTETALVSPIAAEPTDKADSATSAKVDAHKETAAVAKDGAPVTDETIKDEDETTVVSGGDDADVVASPKLDASAVAEVEVKDGAGSALAAANVEKVDTDEGNDAKPVRC